MAIQKLVIICFYTPMSFLQDTFLIGDFPLPTFLYMKKRLKAYKKGFKSL